MKSERKIIKLQTLTPVHIGSGEILKENFDYIKIKDDDALYISPINQTAIIKCLQEKRIKIEQWTACLQRGDNVKTFINKFLPNVSTDDFVKRYILINQQGLSNELREQIYDGLGNPYIPGSSIKGAIRTVIISLLQQKQNGINFKPDSILGDIMRYLQVSDVLFEDGCTDALNMINLNIRQEKSYKDDSKKQLVEAITKDEESSLTIKISDTQKFQVANSIEGLFNLINQHTKRILKNEINFWYDYTEKDDGTLVQDYINACKRINKEINAIATNSCILRLGHANGWKFITGDWAEQKANEIEWSNIVNRSRPKNMAIYSNYPFPKSRRINITGNDRTTKVNLLGFVKLTIENNK